PREHRARRRLSSDRYTPCKSIETFRCVLQLCPSGLSSPTRIQARLSCRAAPRSIDQSSRLSEDEAASDILTYPEICMRIRRNKLPKLRDWRQASPPSPPAPPPEEQRKTRAGRLFWLVAIAAGLFASRASAAEPASFEVLEPEYAADIHPLLTRFCLK